MLLLRLPFLNQAIQGDDHIYLTEAQHALIEPLHPSDVKYVFRGDDGGSARPLPSAAATPGRSPDCCSHLRRREGSSVSRRLHRVLADRGVVHVVAGPPLLAAPAVGHAALYRGAGVRRQRQLASRPTSPSSPSGWPSIALFLSGRLLLAALAMAAATMMAYQAVLLVPILFFGIRLDNLSRDNPSRDRKGAVTAYLTLLTPLIVLIAWQLFTRLTTGTMPAGKLAEYFSTYALQAIQHKLQNALMLFIHAWWIVFPALVPAAAVLAWRRRRDPGTRFLLAWIGIFFAGALVIFFAGSARYLLPMAAPVAILASRLPVKWLAPAFAAQLAIALASRHRQLPALGRLPHVRRRAPRSLRRTPRVGGQRLGPPLLPGEPTTACPRTRASTSVPATSS